MTTKPKITRPPEVSEELHRVLLFHVWKAAKKCGRFVEPNELYSVAWEGTRDIVRRFDPSRGQLSTAVSLRARGAIMDYLRQNDRTRYRRWRKDNPTVANMGDDRSYLGRPDSQPGPASSITEREQFEARIACVRCHRTRLALRLYYVAGCTLAQVGRAIGLSESRISQMITLAHAQIRDSMKGAA